MSFDSEDDLLEAIYAEKHMYCIMEALTPGSCNVRDDDNRIECSYQLSSFRRPDPDDLKHPGKYFVTAHRIPGTKRRGEYAAIQFMFDPETLELDGVVLIMKLPK